MKMSRAYSSDVESREAGSVSVDRSLVAAYKRMKSDMQAAARIQRSLLPTASPRIDGVRVAWSVIPCDELAGDSLNFVRLDDDHLGLYILDVSGHGLEAAMLAVTLHRVLAAITKAPSLLMGQSGGPAGHIVSPAEVCHELNRIFPMDPVNSQFFTLLYGVLDTKTCEFRYATAGHHPPLYLPRRGLPVEIETYGFPIGIVEQAPYEEEVITLGRGGRLYLYSDGMIDAECYYDGPFGKERLLQTIRDARRLSLHDSVSHIIERVRDWSSTSRLEDDASLLALEIV